MARAASAAPPAATPNPAVTALIELETVILNTLDATRVLQIVFEDAREQVVKEGPRGRIVLDLTGEQEAALAYAVMHVGEMALGTKELHARLFGEARSQRA